ncbi:MAG TPA: FecR family protein [Cyclobacteriaceae bacterium]|nr:FecR family protein [Cyclobacteriaceae bacterium]
MLIYDIRFFMLQNDFHLILMRYLRGQATKEEEILIDSWYADLGKETHSSLTSQEESELESHYWSTIAAYMKRSKKKNNYAIHRWYPIGIAASVLLALVSLLYVFGYRASGKGAPDKGKEVAASAWKKMTNTGRAQQLISLPDSSKVRLEPHSTLEFSASFPESVREVFLEGEAFFDVSPDADRPFLVYTNKVITKVVGTSFRVKAFRDDRKVTIAVRTGKVSVYASPENGKENAIPDEIILTPNQQLIYDRDKKKISRMIVDAPQVILPAEKVKRMRFEGAPVSEIFEAIEKVYGLDIVFDKARFSSCTLTTSISDGGLYNRLDIICAAINATYTLKENQIVVEGAGCSNH